MNCCKSIKFCFYLGFAGMIAHAVIASFILLLAFAIEAVTKPMFMDKIMMHEMFSSLCIFLALSWILSPLALSWFRKAIHMTHDCEKQGCSK